MEVFDWRYYINRYSDLRDAGIVNRKKALSHWNRVGKFENRYPNKTVEIYNNNRRKTAKSLGVSERTLYRKIEDYKLEPKIKKN